MVMQRQWEGFPLSLVLIFTLVSLLSTSKLVELSWIYVMRSSPEAARMDPPNMNDLEIDYSYSIEDYPERWSIPVGKVAMQVEESVHYELDTLPSFFEWRQQNIDSRGSIRLGADNHAALLPMFHELHCIEFFKNELRSKEGMVYHHTWKHTQHCANYLRQWALCRADLTLEHGDFAKRDFDWDRRGATHECLAWDDVYSNVNSNWEAWVLLWGTNHLNNFVNQSYYTSTSSVGSE